MWLKKIPTFPITNVRPIKMSQIKQLVINKFKKATKTAPVSALKEFLEPLNHKDLLSRKAMMLSLLILAINYNYQNTKNILR